MPVGRVGRTRSRRSLLRSAGRSAIVAPVALLGLTGAAAPARWAYDIRDPATHRVFDRMFHSADPERGLPTQNNERGGLAWSQSLVLLSFLRMYETYRERAYLERFIANADAVLDQRDSVRGVGDHLGRSRPVWRARHPYTVGVARLADADGVDVLELRAALSYNDETRVSVTHGPDGGFDLSVWNPYHGTSDRFDGLVMDRSSPEYAVRRIYDAYPGDLRVTAANPADGTEVVTESVAGGSTASRPAAGDFAFRSRPAVYAVHTGMITYPLAAFVHLVRSADDGEPAARYRGRAEEYLEAVSAAQAAHDEEWRETSDERGRAIGYFVLPAGAPVALDGVEAPINQNLAIGLGYALVAAVTGDPTARHRVGALARMFAGQLEADAGGAYRWPYWPRFGNAYAGIEPTGRSETDVSINTPSLPPGRQLEDINHASIDIEFAALLGRLGLGYGRDLLGGLGRTYHRNLATTHGGRPAVYAAVNGPDPTEDQPAVLATVSRYLDQVPRWLPLVEQVPPALGRRIYRHALAVTEQHPIRPDVGEALLAIANYQRYAAFGG